MRRRKTSQQPNLKAVRTVVLGKDGVGKSALIVRFLTRRFITEYDQTLEFDFYERVTKLAFICPIAELVRESTWRHHMEVDSEYIYVDLMDTAGENSQTKLDGCLPGGDIFLVLYSITDRASFEEATRIGRHIRERVKTNSTSPMLILIGTKRDLGHLRKVDETEGSDLSGELNCPFYEISVSCCDGYKEVSDMLRGSIRQFLENGKNGSQTDKRNQSSSLLKMKEGFIKRRGSFRKKSASL